MARGSRMMNTKRKGDYFDLLFPDRLHRKCHSMARERFHMENSRYLAEFGIGVSRCTYYTYTAVILFLSMSRDINLPCDKLISG